MVDQSAAMQFLGFHVRSSYHRCVTRHGISQTLTARCAHGGWHTSSTQPPEDRAMSSLIPEMQDLDPDGQRLPIKLDTTTNGEFAPIPLDRRLCTTRITWPMNGPASSRASSAKTRRAFLTTLSGAASTLLAFNAAHARAGRNGGFFEIANDAKLDEQTRRVTARQTRVHLRRAGPLRESDRRVDEAPAARRQAAAVFRARNAISPNNPGSALSRIASGPTSSSRTCSSTRTPT